MSLPTAMIAFEGDWIETRLDQTTLDLAVRHGDLRPATACGIPLTAADYHDIARAEGEGMVPR